MLEPVSPDASAPNDHYRELFLGALPERLSALRSGLERLRSRPSENTRLGLVRRLDALADATRTLGLDAMTPAFSRAANLLRDASEPLGTDCIDAVARELDPISVPDRTDAKPATETAAPIRTLEPLTLEALAPTTSPTPKPTSALSRAPEAPAVRASSTRDDAQVLFAERLHSERAPLPEIDGSPSDSPPQLADPAPKQELASSKAQQRPRPQPAQPNQNPQQSSSRAPSRTSSAGTTAKDVRFDAVALKRKVERLLGEGSLKDKDAPDLAQVVLADLCATPQASLVAKEREKTARGNTPRARDEHAEPSQSKAPGARQHTPDANQRSNSANRRTQSAEESQRVTRRRPRRSLGTSLHSSLREHWANCRARVEATVQRSRELIAERRQIREFEQVSDALDHDTEPDWLPPVAPKTADAVTATTPVHSERSERSLKQRMQRVAAPAALVLLGSAAAFWGTSALGPMLNRAEPVASAPSEVNEEPDEETPSTAGALLRNLASKNSKVVNPEAVDPTLPREESESASAELHPVRLPMPEGVELGADKGLLEINTEGRHKVYVDGVFVGRGPVRRVPLTAGSHPVRTLLGERERTYQVTIETGQRTRLEPMKSAGNR